MLKPIKRFCWQIKSRIRMVQFAGKSGRMLEIGPGSERIKGFETLSIIGGAEVDYVCDASGRLPFPDGTFELICASHILEHIPWYNTLSTLVEWARVLKAKGVLELWVPDALKICEALVEFERNGVDNSHLDGWYRLNDEKDPCKWAAGRIFTYGDGKGTLDHPNWHRALFTPRYLEKLMRDAGLVDIAPLVKDEIRGHDHGWINLGLKGVKP